MSLLALLPTIAATLAVFLLGHVWYHAKVFGGRWIRMTNLAPATVEAGKKRSFFYGLLSLIAALVLVSAMRYVGENLGVQGIPYALFFGAFVWAGFFAPALLGPLLWEGKSAQLYAINGGYWFVALTIASVLLFI